MRRDGRVRRDGVSAVGASHVPLATFMNDRQPRHVPVMADEVVHWLEPRPGIILVDGTFGAGGHARRLAAAVRPGGQVIGLDRDPVAVEEAAARIGHLPIVLVQANFSDLPEVLRSLELGPVEGVLLDLGISSDQLADTGRGFSFMSDGKLDLRFNPREGQPAWRLLERLSEEHLANLLYQYGEERYSRRIARRIVQQRARQPLQTAARLAELVRACVPTAKARKDRIDPATRTFQALRIAVNDELKWLEVALKRVPDCLVPGGRLAVISYHSLEDRRVKTAFRDDDRYEPLTRRPICPSDGEVASNRRSRSAKLRVARRASMPAKVP